MYETWRCCFVQSGGFFHILNGACVILTYIRLKEIDAKTITIVGMWSFAICLAFNFETVESHVVSFLLQISTKHRTQWCLNVKTTNKTHAKWLMIDNQKPIKFRLAFVFSCRFFECGVQFISFHLIAHAWIKSVHKIRTTYIQANTFNNQKNTIYADNVE